MSLPFAIPLIIGTVLGLGLWLMLVPAPSSSRRRFTRRVVMQMRATDPAVRHAEHVRTRDQRGLLAIGMALASPVGLGLGRRLGGDVQRQLLRRLEREGAGRSLADYRTEQVLCALAGAVIGGVWGAAAVLRLGAPGPAVLLLLVGGALSGAWARSWWLGNRISGRETRMLAEFPAIAELLALSVGAGESTLGALERVSRIADGVLAEQFRSVLDRTRSGIPLTESLQEFADRVEVTHISRFVAGIAVAMERGTPLAEVLRSQAQDVRDQDKRELMEMAGRKEIAMMVPLVFMVLPLSVLFAVFPGIAVLQLDL